MNEDPQFHGVWIELTTDGELAFWGADLHTQYNPETQVARVYGHEEEWGRWGAVVQGWDAIPLPTTDATRPSGIGSAPLRLVVRFATHAEFARCVRRIYGFAVR